MKSGMFVTQARIKEMKIVNGRVVVDRNIRQNISPEGEHIFGHNGCKKINIWHRKTIGKKIKRRIVNKGRYTRRNK